MSKTDKWLEQALEFRTPYRSRKSKRKPTKKANHKHEYEPVVLQYWNRYMRVTPEQGWYGGWEECGGKRCVHCGRLEIGFPDGFEPTETRRYFWPMNQLGDICVKYPNLEIVRVKDIYKNKLERAED